MSNRDNYLFDLLFSPPALGAAWPVISHDKNACTMGQVFGTTTDFMDALAGWWHNPFTTTKYCFVAMPGQADSGNLNIYLPGIKAPVVFAIKLSFLNNQFWLAVGESHYQVSIMGSYAKSLFIRLSPEDILSLVKT